MNQYKYAVTPLANRKSIVQGGKYRFTILTSRLIRIEYDNKGRFNDRATQIVINREFPEVVYTVHEEEHLLLIETAHVEIRYTKEAFSPYSLTVRYTGDNSCVTAGSGGIAFWRFGDANACNLKGTTRTLDGVNGSCDLQDGIMSEGMITVLDDSTSMCFGEDGSMIPGKKDAVDMYLFCYGDHQKKYDYRAALKDYYHLTGHTPLLPRYALGNWWSRFHAYTQDEYQDLIRRFAEEEIPFSVAVVDLDWHLRDIAPKYGTGWQGYTWNQQLFPDHAAFLKFLHEKGLKVTLSLHPHHGIAAHEKPYAEMAQAMGIEPETEQTIEFEIENPLFLKNYFQILHDPLEKEGVDFWWLDWQQWNTSRVEGLDAFWMLNHYHFLDNGLKGKRALIFTRYAGPGSHRYPIGFSGDTHITWESLAFQPYFTATASNIGFGWWSHDIGGHFGGYRDDELALRWFQLGVFSPINRLHSSPNRYAGKEPWNYNKICEIAMKKFLQLRHQMMPYLYTMNYRAANEGLPIVEPLYYNFSGREAYLYKTEYCFGSEMLVAPIVKPKDPATMLGSAEVYLPEGEWYDFFNNNRYTGGRTLTVYRDEYEMPVFVKEGGIIPLAVLNGTNNIDNPVNLRVKVYLGHSNSFEMYEDDGESYSYCEGGYALTKMELQWSDNPAFFIHKAQGDTSVIPSVRNYEIELIGYDAEVVRVFMADEEIGAKIEVLGNGILVKVSDVKDNLKIEFQKKRKIQNDVLSRLDKLLNAAAISFAEKSTIYNIFSKDQSMIRKLSALEFLNVDMNVKKAVTEIVTAELDQGEGEV